MSENITKTRPTATAFLRHPSLRDNNELVFLAIQVMMGAGYEATIGWIGIPAADADRLPVRRTPARRTAHPRRRTRRGALAPSPSAKAPGGQTLADCEIACRLIRKGDAVIVSYAAANPDARIQNDDPWLSSGNRAHLAWVAGRTLPSQRHSRVIVHIAGETVLTYLHDVKVTVDPDGNPYTPSFWTACPRRFG